MERYVRSNTARTQVIGSGEDMFPYRYWQPLVLQPPNAQNTAIPVGKPRSGMVSQQGSSALADFCTLPSTKEVADSMLPDMPVDRKDVGPERASFSSSFFWEGFQR